MLNIGVLNMRRSRGIPALAVLAAIAALGMNPGAVEGQAGTPQVTGKLWIEGGSTVRSWDCEAKELQVRVTAREGLTALAIEGLGEVVTAMQVQIPKARLDCDNDTMNDHMWKALKASNHPTITFRMESYRVVQSPAGQPRVEVRGPLQIAGSTQAVVLTLDVTPEGPGLRLKGVHTLDMTTFGMTPPRLMLGTLRVHENVEVHFDLLLSQPGA
jgi:hypothetical protein